jgi:hypothetical protein
LYFTSTSSSQRAFALRILKNGSRFYGGGDNHMESAGDHVMNVESHAVQVIAGDYFELEAYNSGAALTTEVGNSWLVMEYVADTGGTGTAGAALDGALAHATADQTYSTGVIAKMACPTEVYDTGGYHDTGSDTERMTTKASCSRYRAGVTGQWDNDATAAGRSWLIRKNGIGYKGQARMNWDDSGAFIMTAHSAPLVVASPGTDYFGAWGLQNAGNNLNSEGVLVGRSAVSMQALTNWKGGCLIWNAAGQTIAHNTQTFMTWDTADHDDQNIWSAGDPTKLTVPAGFKWCKVQAGVQWAPDATDQDRGIDIVHSGSGSPGTLANYDVNTRNDAIVSCSTGVVPVVAGDFFRARLYHFGGSNLATNSVNTTFFAMELFK